MVDVHFEVYRVFRYDGIEVPETQLDAYLRDHPEFVEELVAQIDMDGALVVAGHPPMLDDLGPLAHNLCFEAVAAVLGDGHAHRWSTFTSPVDMVLQAADDDKVTLSAANAEGTQGIDPWTVTLRDPRAASGALSVRRPLHRIPGAARRQEPD